MLTVQRRAAARLTARQLHASTARQHLVGPPDPVSNLRPIVYQDAPEALTRRHPYSLKEFDGDTAEYQWKIQRQELDAFNHSFWTDSNARFNAAKAEVLESLPESASPLDREQALSDFYRQWAMQERPRQRAYTREWNRRNWTSIWLGLRLSYDRVTTRLLHPFSSRKSRKD